MKTEVNYMKLRSVMKWGVKLKKTEYVKGKLVILEEQKVYTPVKFLEVEHMKNIIRMVQKDPNEIWNQYPASQWIDVLNWEIKYQNSRADVLIAEIMKLQYNTMADMFKAYADIACSVNVTE
jgi:hypothetical protein